MASDNAIENLTKIYKELDSFYAKFISACLIEIKQMANDNLLNSLNYPQGTFGTNMDNMWELKINGLVGELRNNYGNSASVEFGIGTIGENNPHPMANESQYEYNVDSPYKDENGAWNFYDQNGDFWFKFKGYKGKAFLYNALMKFYLSNKAIEIYKSEFDKFMKGILK